MYFLSVSARKWKLIAATLVVGAILCGAIFLVSLYKNGDMIAGYSGVKTAADRLTFIRSFGWEFDENSETCDTVTIPQEFDAIYSRYNKIQIEQGLNLIDAAGKKVERYTYMVTNYPESEAKITLLIFKDKVIGGDVRSPRQNGFLHGFSMPPS